MTSTANRRPLISRTLPLIACTLMLATTGIAVAQKKSGEGAGKKLYCWNENGARVCGDALPAHAVDNARTEINAKSGLATKQVERALTAEERAAAEAQAKLDKEQAAIAEARDRREHAMVESYATEEDLRRAFGERQAVMDESIKASRLGVVGRRDTLVALLRRAGENELAGKPVPLPAQQNVRIQHDQLIRQQELLVQQLAEREVIDEELAAALERYHALKQPSKN
ncbi:hypothetical protein [Lysobacter auxotrophicus]|uniref:DUF4124 domain-containing protein n=1 Tax=Lysobacter auxotrophicus TaxID=2992573 RepID=A0ABN6UPR3_9GAMM|nr:hypothetical protein [Lysobacter auxotrophicus]BDU18382.1 hypothetical protein LA521A_35830 [Lysobacter auxotrophicus]